MSIINQLIMELNTMKARKAIIIMSIQREGQVTVAVMLKVNIIVATRYISITKVNIINIISIIRKRMNRVVAATLIISIIIIIVIVMPVTIISKLK